MGGEFIGIKPDCLRVRHSEEPSDALPGSRWELQVTKSAHMPDGS